MPSACGVSGYVCSNSRGPSGSLQTEADYYDDVEGVVAELVGVEAALEQVRRRLVKATDTLGGVARLSSIPDTGSARQKHAAWCWLPLDHQGQCEGDQ